MVSIWPLPPSSATTAAFGRRANPSLRYRMFSVCFFDAFLLMWILRSKVLLELDLVSMVFFLWEFCALKWIWFFMNELLWLILCYLICGCTCCPADDHEQCFKFETILNIKTFTGNQSLLKLILSICLSILGAVSIGSWMKLEKCLEYIKLHCKPSSCCLNCEFL